MALKKTHATALKDLVRQANRFYNVSSLEKVKEEFKQDFDELMEESGTKITLIERHGAVEAEVVELKRDFLKVAYKNDENISIKSKTQGVEIEVKVWREGKFEFSNEEIADALSKLAEQVIALKDQAVNVDGSLILKGADLYDQFKEPQNPTEIENTEDFEGDELDDWMDSEREVASQEDEEIEEFEELEEHEEQLQDSEQF